MGQLAVSISTLESSGVASLADSTGKVVDRVPYAGNWTKVINHSLIGAIHEDPAVIWLLALIPSGFASSGLNSYRHLHCRPKPFALAGWRQARGDKGRGLLASLANARYSHYHPGRRSWSARARRGEGPTHVRKCSTRLALSSSSHRKKKGALRLGTDLNRRCSASRASRWYDIKAVMNMIFWLLQWSTAWLLETNNAQRFLHFIISFFYLIFLYPSLAVF